METYHNQSAPEAPFAGLGQRRPESCRQLIRGATIYTADGDDRALSAGYLLIEDDRIAALGPLTGDEPNAEDVDAVIDGRGFMILPGFVNAHWHESLAGPYADALDDSHITPSPYSRGGDIPALSSQFGFIASLPDKISFAEGVAIARWSLWTQLRAGTTALGDLGSANNPLALGAAAEQLGIRLRLSRWGSDIAIAADGSVTAIADPHHQAEAWEAIADRYPAGREDVAVMASVCGAFGSSDTQLGLLKAFADRHSGPYATHLAPLANERAICEQAFGRSPIARFSDAGLIGPNLIAVHTNHASEAEFAELLAAKVNICQSPAHNALLGERTLSGSRQLSRFIAEGAPFCTSTDGNVMLVGGMAEALRASYLFHNEASGDNSFLKPLTNLRHGTIAGAHALGWGEAIGSLEVGKKADLVMIDCSDWRYFETHHPLEVFITAGSSKDVDSVWVAGQRLVAGGQSTAFSETELFADYQQATAALRSRLAKG